MEDIYKLKTLDRSVENTANVRDELKKETDRGCALMAAAYLDSQLEAFLRQKLVGTKKSQDELFEANGPLGTFSAKIKLAYSIGLISGTAKKDLEIIRKVRNDFGHNYDPISFETQHIKAQINNLKGNYLSESDKKEVGSRLIFTYTVLSTLVELHVNDFILPGFKERVHNFYGDEKVKEILKPNMQELKSVIL